jgi:trimeric autotransporter adhesin
MKSHVYFNSATRFSLVGRWASRSLLLFTLMLAGSSTPALAQYATGGVTGGTSGGTTATGAGAIAIGGGTGANATAGKADAVAIGDLATSGCASDTAFGNRAKSEGSPMGAPSPCTTLGGATAIGYFSVAKDYASVAIGNSAAVNGNGSIAIGSATVGAFNPTTRAPTALSNSSIAIGAAANAGVDLPGSLRNNSIAIGAGANSVIDAIAVGGQSFAFGDHSVAIGPTAKAGTFSGSVPTTAAPSAVALGTFAEAKSDSSVAVGPAAQATGQFAISLGKSASTNATNSIALGALATASSPYAIVMGSSAASGTAKDYVVSIGASSSTSAGQARDVALGFQSTTAAVNATPNKLITGTTYTFAGGSPASTVSIAAPGIERTLTNLAAGRVSASSTDAVNGSQLDAVIQALTALKTAFDAYKATHP